MDDRIYCVNSKCPYKDCNRSILSIKNEKEKAAIVNTANLAGICTRYAYWEAKQEGTK